MSKNKFLTGVIFGAAAGAIAGILLAPDKGTETRKRIVAKAGDLKSTVIEKAGLIAEKIIDSTKAMGEKYKDSISTVSEKTDIKPAEQNSMA